jgi:hypothetical protein
VPRKNATERQREYRMRARQRKAMGLPPHLTPEEKEARREAKWGIAVGPITRQWCLEQLRSFALEPTKGTPTAIQALKVLLEELPKTSFADTATPKTVKNHVILQRPSEKALDRMLEERLQTGPFPRPPLAEPQHNDGVSDEKIEEVRRAMETATPRDPDDEWDESEDDEP